MQPITRSIAPTEEGPLIGLKGEDIEAFQRHLREVLEGAAFRGSPRSAQFLKHIVSYAIAGRFDSLKERMIGIEVFGRTASYDTGDDAIVRVTASDVRKRLLQHYGQVETLSEFRISLPCGSYVPKITREPRYQQGLNVLTAVHQLQRNSESVAADQHALPISTTSTSDSSISQALSGNRPRRLQWLLLGLLFTAVNIAVSLAFWNHSAQTKAGSVSTLPWSTFLKSSHSIELVTSDPNIEEIQRFTGGQVSLSDYANHNYLPASNLLTPAEKRFYNDILRGDKASVVDTPIAVNVAELAQANSKKINVRGARSVQLSDLQTDENLILLGSPRSNPWSGLFNDRLDFRFEFDKEVAAERIRNVRPHSGELSVYVPTAPGFATGESFAIIAFVQNPDQNGQVLLLAGENGEGTAAAGKLVTDLHRLASTLTKCGISPSGPQQHFEILLRLNMMAGSPSNIDVAACHIL